MLKTFKRVQEDLEPIPLESPKVIPGRIRFQCAARPPGYRKTSTAPGPPALIIRELEGGHLASSSRLPLLNSITTSRLISKAGDDPHQMVAFADTIHETVLIHCFPNSGSAAPLRL